MSSVTTYHIGISIAGALRQPDHELNGALTQDGRELPGKMVKHLLWNARQKNPQLQVFTGDDCDNQDATGRCQGHAKQEASDAQA